MDRAVLDAEPRGEIVFDELAVNDFEAQGIGNALRDISAERAHLTGHCDCDHDAPPEQMPDVRHVRSVVIGLTTPSALGEDCLPVEVQVQGRLPNADES